ncbi:MAG: dephospho-CoA kinase [Mycobacterium sp.]
MLRIGLTGGIGAGKSTVSRTFAECGAVVVDGDVISREVVEPGTDGLAALVAHFGQEILLPDGALNRPALAAIAFSDEGKRQALNGIVHPLVAHRRSELIAAAAEDAVIVEDIPLLVESQMAPLFPLVVMVHADPEVRVRRLITYRGFTEADANARIAAQATEEQRRAVADVWLDNTGSEGQLVERARDLWYQRIVPFAHNLGLRAPADDQKALVSADPDWADQARRIIARLNTACGHRAIRIDHTGSTAVAGLDARDIIDIQITVASMDTADELAANLLQAGYPRVQAITVDAALEGRDELWQKRFHASADPGRPTHLHIRVDGRPNQRFALLFVDWLNANPVAKAEYQEFKRQRSGSPGDWFAQVYPRAQSWAEGVSWVPRPVA